ncbi:MAG TPA: STAS domain-containing protein [Polyangiaceae bacterium]|jgi:rsbT co-antagonist protein RsbR|nr:STAS domain-containing protein [Polyangiaceae bacterium]
MMPGLVDAAAAEETGIRSDLLANISQLLGVIERVGAGETVDSLKSSYSEAHPVGALTASLNEIIASLSEARLRSQSYSRELQEKIAAIEAQDAAIAELSTPILEVWEGVLCMPIVGVMDSARTAEMARTLLNTIVQTKASLALLDITGIQVMDTRVVDHFLRMARAIRLLGARCVLSGVHPNVSQTMVHMGMDFKGIETHRSIREALRHLVDSRTVTVKSRSKGQQALAAAVQPENPPPESSAVVVSE